MAGNLTFNIDANDHASSTFAAVSAQLQELSRQLRALDRQNVRVKVQVDTPSSAQIAQLDRARQAIREIDGRNARARVEITGIPDAATAASLRRTAKALRELDGANATARISVTGDLPNARDLRAAARALRDLAQVGAINIHISITGAVEALAQVVALRRELNSIPRQTSTTVNVDVDKGALSRVAGVGKALLSIGAAGGVAAAGLGTAIPAVATLAGSLASLAGLAPVAAGALAAVGAVGAAIAVGMAHVADALGPRDTAAQLKKVNQAMEALAPAARETVLQLRELGAGFFKMRLDVQQKLFEGLSKTIRSAGDTYMPILKRGLGGITSELNTTAKSVLAFSTQSRTLADVGTIFDNTRVAMRAAQPAAVNLLAAFLDIATVGTGMLPQLAVGWTVATARFREFIGQARESGQLQQWIQGGVDTLKTLGSITGNVGKALYSVFTAAKASGADFLTTVDRVTEKVAKLLASGTAQSAMIAFFQESRSAIDLLTPGVEALTVGVLHLMQSLSESKGISNLAATFTQLAQTVGPLGAAIGSVAGEGLSALAGAASLAGSALAPLVGLVGGVAGGLAGLIGPAVAAAVAFRVLGSAAVAGVFTSSAAALTRMSQSLAFASYGSGALAGAAGAASTATSKMATAISRAGAALPIIGVALIAVGALFEKFGPQADRAAAAVVNGSLSMQRAIQGEADRNAARVISWDRASVAQEAYAQASDSVRAAVEGQLQAMNPLDQAMARVKISQASLNEAILTFGPNSAQASTASQVLGRDQADLAAKQKILADATKGSTEAIKANADAMASQLSTVLGYEASLRQLAAAQKTADQAIKDHGKSSAEAADAIGSLAQQETATADAARKLAQSYGAADGGAAAYNTTLATLPRNSAAAASAFSSIGSALSQTQLDAVSAQAKISGFATEVVNLPGGKTVTVIAEADRAKAIDAMKASLAALQDKTVNINGNPQPLKDALAAVTGQIAASGATINIDGNTLPAADALSTVLGQIAAGRGFVIIDGQSVPADQALQSIIGKIGSSGGMVTINGQTVPAGQALAQLLAMVNGSKGTTTVDANTGPALAKTTAAVTMANGSKGTITIDGNPGPVNGKITAGVSFANGSKGTITIDGNQTPANGKITATVRYANGSTGRILVDANAAAANAAINAAARNRTSTIYVTTSYSSAAVTRQAHGGAIGGIATPMAQGAVATGYAGGGVRKLTPMRGDVAAKIPANSWRVIGDRMQGDEFFLPDNAAPRSMKIGEEWARRRGLSLIPQRTTGTGAGPITSPVMTGPTTSARTVRGSAAGASMDIGPLVSEMRAQLGELRAMRGALAMTGSDSAPVVSALRDLGRQLATTGPSAASTARGAFVASESGAW